MNVDLEIFMCAVDSYGPIGPTWIYKTVNSVQVCGLIKYAGLWADKVCRFVGWCTSSIDINSNCRICYAQTAVLCFA